MNKLSLYLASTIYKKYLESNQNRLWSRFRDFLIRALDDPTCKLVIHGKPLYLPLSHALPVYLKGFPMYDRLPQRLGVFLRQTYGFVCLIDVGANIGDTIAAILDDNAKDDSYLAIEPNGHFRKYLSLNWGKANNVEILPYFCTGNKQPAYKYQIIESNGTAQIVENSEGLVLQERTADQIIIEKPAFRICNFFKIDTDGHDFEVINGASKLIADNLPVILFECDISLNENYIDDCIDTLKSSKRLGYSSFLLYDNFGYLMGKYSLTDLQSFLHLLFYQLTSPFYYFDILLMKEDDILVFQKSELGHYSSFISDPYTTKAAQSLIAMENLS